VKLLGLHDVLAVAAHVLRRDSASVVRQTALDAVEQTLAEVRDAAYDDPALAAAALLSGLVRRRPFPALNRTIAVACTLQLLALNGCDLRLEPVDETDSLLDKVVADGLPVAVLADELRTRMMRLRGSRRDRRRGEDTPMFERFTDQAREAVSLAQQEAVALRHDHIGTEHVLLGLVHEGGGLATRVLEQLGISLSAVRAQVEQTAGSGQGSPAGHIPFTPRAKKALELALREALQLGHSYIGTEHLLLGLIREGHGVAAQVLVRLGASLGEVRAEVIRQLGSGAHDAVAGPSHDDGRRSHLMAEIGAVLDENDRLHREVARLRRLLHDHGLDADAS